ncbi:MAG: right-handed parallel beta-helix repeat-containing protein [Candidatus Eisenbacteria bacterium]|uniref:Right-handed parallel beta-helix repeat-containing protein n=1 Tax=Eiseniibacteriota bacterium TaxID=2212470 RepID=A0A948RZ26_UNCEI|nr:right-handed parallel beta-helix repeat-containing protein [Candidatus Eisenbacteria bacterium]MBU1948359.1 right-handed parallel beta-helix repeat-containing protein [Candidatus Eisenbacteria bacterium]MBU2692252.1 right-handed parallel beta-helix repeat-containing protein [Candidatus Eisenbacteria bacterium]
MLDRLWITLLLLIFLPAPSMTATWTVYEDGSGDAPTIQAALDSTSSGDTVLVYPGTYHESPTRYNLAELTLLGVSGRDDTIIDLAGGHSSFGIVYFVISGFCFENGDHVYIQSAYYSVHDCTFRDLDSDSGGNIVLTDTNDHGYNYFEDNLVTDNGSVGGPIMRADNAFVRGNLFSDNTCIMEYHLDPAGIFFPGGRFSRIEENIFTNNYAELGTIIVSLFSEPQFLEMTLWNNIFYHNQALIIWSDYDFAASIENNILVSTSANNPFTDSARPFEPPSCNILWNIEYDTEVFAEEDWNLYLDPRFCGAEIGDFTVNVGSVCLPENQPVGMNCGLIGIFEAGCPTPTKNISWGLLKRYFKTK